VCSKSRRRWNEGWNEEWKSGLFRRFLYSLQLHEVGVDGRGITRLYQYDLEGRAESQPMIRSTGKKWTLGHEDFLG